MTYPHPALILLVSTVCMCAGGCYSTAWYEGDGVMVRPEHGAADYALFLPEISLTQERTWRFEMDRLPNQSAAVFLFTNSEEEYGRALRSGAVITMRVEHANRTVIEFSGTPGFKWFGREKAYVPNPDAGYRLEPVRVFDGGSLTGKPFEKVAGHGPYVITFAVKPSHEGERAEEITLHPVVLFDYWKRMWVP